MHSAVSTATIVITPPAVVLIVNPLMFYASQGLLILTCLVVVVHIVLSCNKRNKRLDAIMTRAIRRENARKLRSGDSKEC